MIEPTEADIGRRVKNNRWEALAGKLVDHKPCGKCKGPCCSVHYDGERWPVASDPTQLHWADEVLL